MVHMDPKTEGRIIRHRVSLFEKTLFLETQGQNLAFGYRQARSRGYLSETCLHAVEVSWREDDIGTIANAPSLFLDTLCDLIVTHCVTQ